MIPPPTETDLVDRLRRQAQCVYLATDAVTADDLSNGLLAAAKRIAELEAEVARLRADMLAAFERIAAQSEQLPPRGGEGE